LKLETLRRSQLRPLEHATLRLSCKWS